MASFVDPFLPEILDKAYTKRENKKKTDTEIKILNDTEGLFNYLTAPNIRHKVKHPVFLCLKFSNCVKLFINTKMFSEKKKEIYLEILQKRLTKEHSAKSPPTDTGKLEDKYFILYVEENLEAFKNKKINEAIDILKC